MLDVDQKIKQLLENGMIKPPKGSSVRITEGKLQEMIEEELAQEIMRGRGTRQPTVSSRPAPAGNTRFPAFMAGAALGAAGTLGVQNIGSNMEEPAAKVQQVGADDKVAEAVNVFRDMNPGEYTNDAALTAAIKEVTGGTGRLRYSQFEAIKDVYYQKMSGDELQEGMIDAMLGDEEMIDEMIDEEEEEYIKPRNPDPMRPTQKVYTAGENDAIAPPARTDAYRLEKMRQRMRRTNV